MDKLISIIIPAYNVENYVHRAIESSIKQTYPDIEIIIVDDGSTDQTWCRINEYAMKDKRIIPIHQKNKGVSAARNLALSVASGKYVLFLDSDDWLEYNAVEKLLEIEKENQKKLPMVDCYYTNLEENGKISRIRGDNKTGNIETEKEESLFFILKQECRIRSSCYKLFDLDIIRKNDLRFDIKIYHGEDGLFVFEYLNYVDGFIYKNLPLWNILTRPGSATQSGYSPLQITAIDAAEKMLSYAQSEKLKNTIKKYLVSRALGVQNAAMKEKEIPKSDIVKIRKRYRKYGACYVKGNFTVRRMVYYSVMAYLPVSVATCIIKGIHKIKRVCTK